MDESLHDKIDMFIMNSMKSGDKVRTETFRAIKTAFLNWKTDKVNIGKEITYSVEVQILNKMIKMRMDAIDQFEEANRQDLANNERAQIQVLKEFLPAIVTKEQIEKAFEVVQLENGWELVKKNMSNYIKAIKVIYPSADGKLISDIVKEKLQ
jgi:hypothetical protein